VNIGIIIPAYNGGKKLERCIEAINNLETEHDVVTFTHDNTKDNLGFTKAVNIGLKNFMDGMTDYCVVLNQDCYLRPDFIDNIVKFMEEHPKCAIAGPKQVLESDEDMIIHGGCTTAFPEGRHIVGRKSENHCNKNKQMPWVNGACMVVNMSLMPYFGLMDEGFFLIGSDSDWCYIARQRNFEVWYVADAEVIHEGDGISTKGTENKELEFKKYLDIMYFKDKWIEDGCFRELSMEVFG